MHTFNRISTDAIAITGNNVKVYAIELEKSGVNKRKMYNYMTTKYFDDVMWFIIKRLFSRKEQRCQ